MSTPGPVRRARYENVPTPPRLSTTEPLGRGRLRYETRAQLPAPIRPSMSSAVPSRVDSAVNLHETLMLPRSRVSVRAGATDALAAVPAISAVEADAAIVSAASAAPSARLLVRPWMRIAPRGRSSAPSLCGGYH